MYIYIGLNRPQLVTAVHLFTVTGCERDKEASRH